MWMGGGTAPCEIEQYESDRRNTKIGCVGLLLVAVFILAIWHFSSLI
jgi:hypothetical protein